MSALASNLILLALLLAAVVAVIGFASQHSPDADGCRSAGGHWHPYLASCDFGGAR